MALDLVIAADCLEVDFLGSKMQRELCMLRKTDNSEIAWEAGSL